MLIKDFMNLYCLKHGEITKEDDNIGDLFWQTSQKIVFELYQQ